MVARRAVAARLPKAGCDVVRLQAPANLACRCGELELWALRLA